MSLAFFLSTIIGTLSHELGHYTVAKSLGYYSKVSYGYTIWDDTTNRPFIDSIYSKYYKEIESNQDFPRKKEFDLIQKKYNKDGFYITLGGPIQTMLTGSFGFILLLTQKRKIIERDRINPYQWLSIFLCLFWLRQSVNFIVWVITYLINNKVLTRSDEIRIAISLSLPKESLTIFTALVGIAVLIFVIFKIIPTKKRFTFILAGLFGGTFGYFFWLFWIGPKLMP
ncbi:hypothetical protein ACFOWM_07105 [Ferruginibacter yonginensis]|uniref:Peptidase M50 domain-containing protein n=1 Tax=Ferruginibacter yonginensis TaxID=1310416 RepID=A0ABV8QS05_9BACT